MKLSIGSKLALSNAVYIIPILVLVGFVSATKDEFIDFAKMEALGNEYQAPLMRAFSHASTGGDWSKLNQELSALEALQTSHSLPLKFTNEELASRKRTDFQITKLREVASKQDAPETIRILRGMIAHLGDTSNLILDPDLDSYYLMDVTLLALPQTADRLNEISRFVSALPQGRELSPKDRAQVSTYHALLKLSDFDRVTADMDTVSNEDGNFYGVEPTLSARLLPAAHKWNESMITTLKALETLAALTRPVSAADIEKTIHSINASTQGVFSYWIEAETTLQNMLQSRIQTHSNQKTQYLLQALLAAIAAAVASTLLGLSIKNGVMDSVKGAIQSLRGLSNIVTNTNKTLLVTSSSLKDTMNKQASAIEETAASIEEINSMVKKSVENAEISNHEAQKSHQVATQGKREIESMIQSMETLNQSVENMSQQSKESNVQMKEIVQTILEIDQKTKVINDIVFQTKLLSFNASVEAARAGEHGRGFSVVAEEVGNLAKMSGQSAQDISALLQQSIQRVQEIAQSNEVKMKSLVNDAESRLKSGVTLAESCGNSLMQVLSNVGRVSEQMSSMLEASRQQAAGIDQITSAIHEMDKITSHTTEDANQTSISARTLEEQVRQLDNTTQSLEQQVGLINSPRTTAEYAKPNTNSQRRQHASEINGSEVSPSNQDRVSKSQKPNKQSHPSHHAPIPQASPKPYQAPALTQTNTALPSELPHHEHGGFEDITGPGAEQNTGRQNRAA